MNRVPSARWKPAAAAAGAALLVAALGGTVTQIGPWYAALVKPSWQPPDWLFAPAWTLIYALTALAGYRAWLEAQSKRAREVVIGVYALNGFLNVLWSLLFFALQRPDWALGEAVLLWLSVALLMRVSAPHARSTVWLLAPYLAWVTFATALNAAIVRLNAPFG